MSLLQNNIDGQIQLAKKNFANHKAKFHHLIENNSSAGYSSANHFGEMFALDWRNENGSSKYYIRYVFDTNHGNLYITGDLGSAVLKLTEKAKLDTLAEYSLDYFVSKIKCSTDKYVFDKTPAKTELMEILLPNDRPLPKEEIAARKKLINEILKDFDSDKGCTPDTVPYELFSIDPDCYEWLGSIGRCIDVRVIAWFVGLQMAYGQLKTEEERSKQHV